MRRLTSCVLLSLVAALGPAFPAFSDERPAAEGRVLPDGLATFLRAKELQSQGSYREASQAFSQAIILAPEVNEIRVAYGSMLLDIGMPNKVIEVLEGRQGLDWYGKRTLALALGQMSTQKPELLGRAKTALKEALAERSDDPNLQLTLAQVLSATGESAEAERLVAELREGMRGSVRIELFHAQLLAETGRPAEAAEVVARCAQPPESVDQCRDIRVRMLVASGQPGVAGAELAGWLAADDLDGHLRAAALLMDGGRPEQALDLVRAVLFREPDSPGANQMEVMLLVELGRFEEARPRLKSFLKKNPNSLELLVASAWAAAAGGEGDIEEARGFLDRAWELVSEDAGSRAATRVCLNAAQLEITAGHPTASREWLDRIADFDTAGPQLPFLLAETYRFNEDWAGGAAALLRLQPHLSDIARAPALALEIEFRMKAGDGGAMARLQPLLESDRVSDVLMALQVMQSLERWDALIEKSGEAVERFPEERLLAFIHGGALERGGLPDEAAVVFEKLLESDPQDAEAANYLGYMWADAGKNLDRALQLIQLAVEASPGNASYIDSLGWVEYRLGRLEEAERWLRRAVDLGGGGQGTVMAHLGEVILHLGRDDEARELLQRALDLGCEHPEHVRTLLDGIRDRQR